MLHCLARRGAMLLCTPCRLERCELTIGAIMCWVRGSSHEEHKQIARDLTHCIRTREGKLVRYMIIVSFNRTPW